MIIDYDKKNKEIQDIVLTNRYGYITSVSGYKIVSNGPNVSIGDLCSIQTESENIICEVVGFKGKDKYLMPFRPLYSVKEGEVVQRLSKNLTIDISEDYLGCILNGVGDIIQDNGVSDKRKDKVFLYNQAPSPTERGKIDTVFETGMKSIDGCLTIGVGQRIGVFAGSGVGKSTLLGNIVKNSNADIKIICLLGERGRELNEFIDILGDELKESILVTATSNESALLRLKSAYTATSIAEYFRDQGKNVLLVMDSLTRFAMAQRDIASNIGEIGVNKGYPPSVFNMLPELLERTGKNEKGSITAIYTVLVEGDDENEIISDTVRGILDGHIVLSRELAERKHFPAIDVLKSVSRLLDAITDEEHQKAITNVNAILSYCKENESFLSIHYNKGSSPNIDRILEYKDIINKFLVQRKNDKYSIKTSRDYLVKTFSNINVKL